MYTCMYLIKLEFMEGSGNISHGVTEVSVTCGETGSRKHVTCKVKECTTHIHVQAQGAHCKKGFQLAHTGTYVLCICRSTYMYVHICVHTGVTTYYSMYYSTHTTLTCMYCMQHTSLSQCHTDAGRVTCSPCRQSTSTPEYSGSRRVSI